MAEKRYGLDEKETTLAPAMPNVSVTVCEVFGHLDSTVVVTFGKRVPIVAERRNRVSSASQKGKTDCFALVKSRGDWQTPRFGIAAGSHDGEITVLKHCRIADLVALAPLQSNEAEPATSCKAVANRAAGVAISD